MPLLETFIAILVRFGQIIIAPIHKPDMLWVLLAVYFNWILTDYFQERKGTDLGNAATNGFMGIWVGADWIRTYIKDTTARISPILQIGVSIFFIAYGIAIMYLSAKGKAIAKYVGRVREISYLAIVFTPIFYGVVPFDLITVGAILLFFPIFYLIGEAVDRFLPAPPEDTDMPVDIGGDKTMDLGMPSTPDMGMQQQGFDQQGAGQGMPRF